MGGRSPLSFSLGGILHLYHSLAVDAGAHAQLACIPFFMLARAVAPPISRCGLAVLCLVAVTVALVRFLLLSLFLVADLGGPPGLGPASSPGLY